MKKHFLIIGIMIVTLILSSCSLQDERGIEAKVLAVTDGDTMKVELNNGQEEKVRFTLVDTPETKHPRLGVQPFGKEASKFTTENLTGKNVILEMDVQERDQYGRLLAYVWVDGLLFNQSLVEKGLARVAVFPPNTKYVDQFRDAEDKAKAEGVGIWSIENYVQEDGYEAEKKEKLESVTGNDTNCKDQIKGNTNSMIYHLPTGNYYDTVSEHNIVWFCSEEEAENAGFRASKR